MAQKAKAFIFDHDGTIADTQRIHSFIESDMLASCGIAISPEEITSRYAGVPMRAMIPELCAERKVPLPNIDEFADEKYRRLFAAKDKIRPIPGTIEFIRQLYSVGILLAVASTSRRAFVDMSLGVLGIEGEFAVVTSGTEVVNGKPAPDIFLLAAKRLGVEPSDCVVVEDGMSGMIGARAAGMRCIAIAEDLSADLPVDLVVSDLRNVPRSFYL